MVSGKLRVCLKILMLTLIFHVASGQSNVPLGIHYQAVARDNYGKELINEKIDVRFSIISGSPDGMISYMEVHSNVITSKFGVFSLVIGKGVRAGGSSGELVQVEWSKALHFLKVEVKFENDYVDMGTMQFLAVPYALFAQKSLEPGPPGPRGETGPPGVKGDPASDNQTLSFDGSNLSISGGNTLTLNDLLQNLTVTYQPDGTYLGISKGNSVKLANIESDGDPKNEIQDITINSDVLKITNNPEASEWDLTRYLDDTDKQKLTWDPVKRRIGIIGDTTTIGLSELKNDADADPSNELQDLSWDESNKQLNITGGDPVVLGQLVAFKAGVTLTTTLPNDTPFDLIFNENFYNDGGFYNLTNGIFQVPFDGIYTFRVSITLPPNGSLIIKSGTYSETIIGPNGAGGTFKENITLKLIKNEQVSIVVKQTNGFPYPCTLSGYFSGYRVY